jgi:replicative DNA helicase
MKSKDQERLFVGALLRTPALAADTARLVSHEDFTDRSCAGTYRAIVELTAQGTTDLDIFTVARHLSNTEEGQRKIAMWLDAVQDGVPRHTSLESHARLIRRRATLRVAEHRLGLLREKVQAHIESNSEADDFEEELTTLAVELAIRDDARLNRTTIKDRVSQLLHYLDALALHQSSPGAIPTGITALDVRLGGGLLPGKLYVVAAVSGSGKSAFGSQMADSAAKGGFRSVMFSMEMDADDVYLRDVEREVGRSRWELRGPAELRDSAMEDLAQGLAAMANWPNRKVVYSNKVTLAEIQRAVMVEGLRMGGPVQCMVVDHAQVVAPGKERPSRGPQRYLEVKDIAETLRSLAYRRGIACVLTAQLNPPPKGEKPTMFLMRESKDLGNAADAVILIHHEKEEEDIPAHMVGGRRRRARIVGSELIVDKLRFGGSGSIAVSWSGATFKFGDA